MNKKISKKLISLALCLAMVLSYIPGGILRTAAASTDPAVSTVADPQTLTRPGTIYGDSTVNAGKITVGKSVSTESVTVNGQTVTLDGENNFLVTISQSAQVMGLAQESSVPVDVVFVLDTSGSMDDNNRAETMVTAANSAIATLMSANEQNRIGVVAFSSEDYGGGTSNDAAASVLSSLAHYNGAAATAHLQWVNSNGTASASGEYIAGRDTVTLGSGRNQRTVNAYRNGTDGGTHIQAGIIEGAKMLTSVENTTYTDPTTGETVTRIPFLVILSDGQPTFSYSDDTWYDPDSVTQQGSGSDAYEGNGFIAAMTAAYYKTQITNHYYGEKAGGDNHCYIYTLGVELDSLSGDEETLAQITLDPKTYTTGSYAEENAASYWNYGNTSDNETKNAAYGWKSYWNSYLAGKAFGVRVNSGSGYYVWSGTGEAQEYYELEEPRRPGWNASQATWDKYYEDLEAYEAWEKWVADNFTRVSGQHYTFTADSIAATRSSISTIAYNDQYYNASSVDEMEAVFEAMVTTIQQKAISVPTKVTSGDHDFDGYVTFTDPLGEYMEVKDMKGVVAGGYFYQGASFARKLASGDSELDALLHKVLKTRMGLSDADSRFSSEAELDAFLTRFLSSVKNSPNQGYYKSASDYDNSLVWWGNAYDSGEEDEHVQLIGFADNDTIEYITDENTVIPEGADYVCRSYFFYGEAGGANPNPDHEYLYFMVRVQRELAAPYRETVVISAPASLLSMEKVLVTEATDDNGNTVYTAAVEHQEPARVVYEVGLWDSINPQSVSTIVSADYAAETVNGGGSVNYDAENDTYSFFTNDWDRTESLSSHHRAMAKATFDAAPDNEFYTYQEDTLIVDANGNAVTADPAGTTAYYVREYYEWSDGGKDGTYTATKKSALIRVDIPANAQLVQKDGKWYLGKGMYTAATLIVNGDDTTKSENATGTSSVVAHPHRTGEATNSHYTVLLGNNGKITVKSDPYVPQKSVSVNLPADATQLVDGNGNPVKVGDVLTYTVEAKNILGEAADLTVTDYVPLGTAFVEGSAGSGEQPTGHTKDATIKPNENNVLTWVLEAVPAGETRYVSFQAVVTEAAMSLTAVPGNLTNTAQISLGNDASVTSTTTTNPIFGKSVTDVNNQTVAGSHGLKVGDTLVYHIRFHNNATDADGNFVPAKVTVTDKVPAGTTFLSADNGGAYDAATGIVTWQFDAMAANTSMVVSFRVQVDASAKAENGEVYIPNTANITVENEPIVTNTVENWADVGDMTISKQVAAGDTTKTFLILMSEASGKLTGSYVLLRGAAQESVLFTNGRAAVTIHHGETLTIKDLPAGTVISVAEDLSNAPGWTAAYNTQNVTIVKGAAVAVSSVSVTNTYALQPLTLTLKGVKKLQGVALPNAVTFGFVAQPDANNPVAGDPITGEVTVQATGEYAFTMSPKVFTQPGTYKYTVTELDGGKPGVEYDKTAYQLVITVVDNGDGTLSATATVDGQSFDMADALTFTNTYKPADTYVQLTAGKRLLGRTLHAGEFSFQLTDGTHVYKGINDEKGNILFEAIAYTAAGEHTYTLSEIIPANKAQGVSYDTSTYTVKVVVADVDGQLTPTVTVEGKAAAITDGVVNTGVVFANSFEPDDVPLTILAKKNLKTFANGAYADARPEAGKFRFQIVNKATGAVMATGSNAADGTVTFDTIYFSNEMLGSATSKTFTLVVSEVVPELAKDANMRYDLTGREITATLTQKADGSLSVAVNGDSDGKVDLTDSLVFTNYQNPSSVEVTPVGTKTTKDAPAGVSFSFTVVNTDTGNEAAAGVGDANGSITFSALSFSEPGTYTYWIREANAGNTTNGITYDLSRYLMKVVVSRNEYNRLVAEVTYWSSNVDGSENVADYTVAANAPSFHNEYNAGGYINLTAKKVLRGRTLAAGEFAFKLTRQDNGGEIDGIVASDGTITFSTMYYSAADIPAGQTSAVIHYVMSEVVPTTAALPGVTYDKTTHDVYVRITDNGNGTITAELVKPEGNGYTAISGTDTGVVFTNTYAAVKGDVVAYRIRKDLQGRDVRAGEFEFGLYQNGQRIDIFSNDENGYVTFTRTIPATAAAYAGIYEMVIREETGSIAGVTYSQQEYKVYVKITDDGKGSIVATVHLTEDGPALAEDANGVVDLTDKFVFTNTYKANDTTFTPTATKALTGRTLHAGEFSFEAKLVKSGDKVITDGAVYRGVNDADGKVVFESIPYTAAGTHIYRISEVTGSAEGMKYDTAKYYLQVTVTDDGTGHLKATGVCYSDADCTDRINAITFRNAYTPADARVQLEATKTLSGRALENNEFSFVVRENDVNGKIVATGSNDAQGKITFSTFNITADQLAGAASKTFTYVMLESDNNLPGITTDKTVHTVKVTVTDNGTGGLTATVAYPGGEVSFHNTYKPNSVEQLLTGHKTLVGKNLKDGEFTFELRNAAGEVVQSQTNDANGVIAFEALKFEKAGTYTYTVTEKKGADSRVDYDETVYTVTVTVTDDGKGNLSTALSVTANGQSVQHMAFTNTYTPTKLAVELEGTKLITDAQGNALTFAPEGFEFEVRDAAGQLITTAKSNAEGKILFTGLEFTAAGEYRFLITEKATDKPGYTVDPTVWCAHITVSYDAETGMLAEAGEYIHIAPETHDGVVAIASESLTFTNIYEPADLSLTLKLKKNLTGRELKDHEFLFYMVDKATGLRAAESRNHANGEIPFHLTFDKAGTYTFVVTEVDEQKLGVTYSQASYEITVTVTDDGSGVLKAQVGSLTVVGSGSVDMTATAVFTNTYKALPGELTLHGRKLMTGKQLEEKEFSFTLLETEADFVTVKEGGVKETVENAANGTIAFSKLTYAEVGTHYYVVSEYIPDEGVEGVTYDAAMYMVTVNVFDDGSGKLNTAVELNRKDEVTTSVGEILFHNSYAEVPKAFVTLDLKKVMTGDKTDPTGFHFGLFASETATEALKTVTSDADGEVSFEQLVFKAAGSYTYYVREILPVVDGKTVSTKDNVTYDTTVYRVDITVTENADGTLSATWKVDGKDVEDGYRFTFTNRYKKPAASTPQTGDNTDLVLWAVLLLTGAMGMIALPVLRKRSVR